MVLTTERLMRHRAHNVKATVRPTGFEGADAVICA
jgi:hypothetical protein